MKKRLIDAEKVIRDLTAMKAQLGVDAILIDAMVDGLKRQPKVDAVEVVQCKDCKHSLTNNQRYICCRRNGFNSALNFYSDSFCSFGERRIGNASD